MGRFRHSSGYVCSECKFKVWNPVGETDNSIVGFYNDGRFPGRCIVLLRSHFDHILDVPDDLFHTFMMDVRRASQAVAQVAGAERMNIAVLGNKEPHVHAHVIPRHATELRPEQPPWSTGTEWFSLDPGDAASWAFSVKEGLLTGPDADS